MFEETGVLDEGDLDSALKEARVPDQFVAELKFANVSPGVVAPTVKSQAEAYRRAGVLGIFHSLTGGEPVETMKKIIADGAMSSTTCRMDRGVVKGGMSSTADLNTGGGDSVFTRVVTNPAAPGTHVVVINTEVLQRLDWYNFTGDHFGTNDVGDRSQPTQALRDIVKRSLEASAKEPVTPDKVQGQLDLWIRGNINSHGMGNSFLSRPTGALSVAQLASQPGNEMMHQCGLPLRDLVEFVVPDEAQRKGIVQGFKDKGINEINGAPVEGFIKARATVLPGKGESSGGVPASYSAPQPLPPRAVDPYDLFVKVNPPRDETFDAVA